MYFYDFYEKISNNFTVISCIEMKRFDSRLILKDVTYIYIINNKHY